MVILKRFFLLLSLHQSGAFSESIHPLQQSSSRNLQDDNGQSAFAYLCDGNNEKVTSDKPVEEGEEVRVCVERGRYAKLQDWYIMKINTFEFYKQVDGDSPVQQKVIDHGALTELGNTRFANCPRGSEICSFVTLLKSKFFDSDGTVKGIGSVALQDGTGSRKLVEVVSLRGGENQQNNERELQDFVSMSGVTLEFAVEDGVNKNPIKYARWNFKEYWNDSPDHIQALYIVGILILFLLCVCFCSGLLLWKHCCADVVERNRRRRREAPDHIFVNTNDEENAKNRSGAKDSDVSETHSVDDDLEVSTNEEESNPSCELLEYNTSSRRSATGKQPRRSTRNVSETGMVLYEESTTEGSSRR